MPIVQIIEDKANRFFMRTGVNLRRIGNLVQETILVLPQFEISGARTERVSDVYALVPFRYVRVKKGPDLRHKP